jgi:hypothetical protein
MSNMRDLINLSESIDLSNFPRSVKDAPENKAVLDKILHAATVLEKFAAAHGVPTHALKTFMFSLSMDGATMDDAA